MDVVSAVLDGHRARGAFLLRCVMEPPWGVRIADRAAVAVLVMVRGELALTPTEGAPRTLHAGDVAIVKRAEPYLLADTAARAPSVVVEPGQVCRDIVGVAGSAPIGMSPHGVWGNDPHGSCAFVVGIYELPGQISGRLLQAVPDLVVVEADKEPVAGVELLIGEFARAGAGQEVVLDRLVDLVLVTTLRAWLARAGDAAPSWWTAGRDPVIGAALENVHARPERPWTLDTLAREAGVSRATLARRFTDLVGQSPMAYLTDWRMRTAADRLLGGSDSIERISRDVGYLNPFAFSTAFKRHQGQSPRAYRAGGRSGARVAIPTLG